MAHRQRLILNAKESGKLKMISTSLDTLPTEILNESYYSSGSTVDFNQAYTQVSELTQITFIDNNLTNIPSELISVHPNITHIDFQKNKLTTINKDICNLQNLQYLDLSFNNLSELPSNWFNKNLLKLTNLILNNNKISKLPSLLFSNITFLDISSNQFTQFPDDLEFCSQLRKLNISKNRITGKIPKLSNLILLEEFDVSDNLISDLNGLDLGSLVRLDCKQNKLLSMKDWKTDQFSLVKLPKCKELLLAFNQLTLLPSDIVYSCPQIQVLDLRNNKLTSLSNISDIPKFTSLQRLDISNNDLSKIPYEIGFLSLITLNISGNPIRNMPRDSTTSDILEWLRSRVVKDNDDDILNLSSNAKSLGVNTMNLKEDGKSSNETIVTASKWSILPSPTPASPNSLSNSSNNSSYSKLKPLISTNVDLSSQQLTELPNFSIDAKIIQNLNLTNNQLSSIPNISKSSPIEIFYNLKSLNLTRNRIAQLSNDFHVVFPNLVELNLSLNKLSNVFNPILPNSLNSLILTGNQIQRIENPTGSGSNNGKGIFELEFLHTLDISNNSLDKLPLELVKLKKLNCLKVDGNIFKIPRQSIVNSGSEAILKWLSLQAS